MRTTRGIFQKIDWVLVGLYMILILIGWLNIYAAVYDEEHSSILDIHQKYGKQMLFIIAALLIATVTLFIEPKLFNQFAWFIYGISIVFLILVIFMGREISGSKSWFQVGGFGVQPAEFAKMATALALARFLSRQEMDLKKLNNLARAVAIFLIPFAIVILQHDTGSALVFLSFILVLYRAGMTGLVLVAILVVPVLAVLALLVNKIILAAILIVPAVLFYLRSRRRLRNILAILMVYLACVGVIFSVDFAFKKVLKPHQRERIEVLLGKKSDLKGAGYNVNQSLIAIGSGQLTGKGYLQGTQTKFNFVPEQSTDFIFCTIGEEWGFFGSVVLILLFMALFIRIILAAERQRSRFSRLYGYGVASVLFFHFAVNIGMALGLLPVIGIPLPFISYGGSSLWAFTILLFIFIRQDSFRYELV